MEFTHKYISLARSYKPVISPGIKWSRDISGHSDQITVAYKDMTFKLPMYVLPFVYSLVEPMYDGGEIVLRVELCPLDENFNPDLSKKVIEWYNGKKNTFSDEFVRGFKDGINPLKLVENVQNFVDGKAPNVRNKPVKVK